MAVCSINASATILPLLITASLTICHLTSPVSASNRLNPGERLHTFYSLTYQGRYKLEMNKFCDLVFTDMSQNKEIWASGTRGKGFFCTLKMQSDGNLVMYKGMGTVVWASNTNLQSSNNRFFLEVTENVAIRDNKNVIIWFNGINFAH
ncbi:mannose-specific lectin-like [Phalaenopsis equestris]|uniref:mannose-specific lectin-like n=1 Tax=Phalaenopsis equestris TaxID=78828 RepID=UPI0009E433BB|nr:mannose-specific lectin-like [Phalaenopsis equestris]